MTHIINLYGGPGSGKSTTAAYMFSLLKFRGVNCELVQEYAKQWAWEGRPITALDQFHLWGDQQRRESILLGRCDVVVTDSPLLLGVYFSRHFGHYAIANATEAALRAYMAELDREGHTTEHVFVRRIKPYEQAGRFQTAEQAQAMDSEQLRLASRVFGQVGELVPTPGSIRDFVDARYT